MKTILEHPEAVIEITELSDGKRQISVCPKTFPLAPIDRTRITAYPPALIETILNVKGPKALNDEIRRDEDSQYVRLCIEKELKAYLQPTGFSGKRILDFGCGAGASTINLARLFPDAEIVGIELEPKLVELANLRKQHYDLPNVTFYLSPDGQTLPPALGTFDFIVFSAVFEHLLDNERPTILRQIWSLLRTDGILFINQTPYRYFPFEGHTTRLLFINYLPDRMAFWYARNFSGRRKGTKSWTQLRRAGIRGGSPTEIKKLLKQADTQYRPQILKPSQPPYRDRIDIWYAGYAVTIAAKYPKFQRIQQILRIVAKCIYYTTGIAFLPSLSLAIRKSAL
ncbi:MAG: class I SAM-dependent methyltransferase [Planctomycetota bacterium]|jgi:SAM-dependent methyltransferase